MEAAHCWIELGQPDRAITALQQGLASWHPNFRRDLGLGLARLAVAYAYTGAVDEALAAGHQAAVIAEQTASQRTRQQLDHTIQRLASAGAHDAAEELRHMLTALR